MKKIIGIDPDSDKHGVAVYEDGKLIALKSLNLPDLLDELRTGLIKNRYHFSIEDVCANSFIYSRNKNSNRNVENKIAMSIGKVQQSQIELMRMLDWYGITYELHKPQKGNWAKDKAKFEKATGWTKQSNEDTRSAAYFGFLAIK